ncbi:MAG: argininosuccinate lyase [Deltaproteobacteria bacterium]|nr:argininosuccinate lyase [Deltaproteobacteria bacterium]
MDVDAELMDYCAQEDVLLDNALLPFDVAASLAHVHGLQKIGILDENEAMTLDDAIKELHAEARDGRFTTTPADEDGHAAIERELTQRVGDVGKKVHTGRSRNDQVLVASRLWLRDRLLRLSKIVQEGARVALVRAEQTRDVVMPGYTHIQRAVPSTAGFWFAGHAESLLEDAAALLDAHALLDRSPLGTAAGYGVNLDLARDDCAKDLGFSRLQLNGIAAQNSRGKLEAHVVGCLLLPMNTARRVAWDVSLFSTAEFALVRQPSRWTTGSSIMPNKRNPDVAELLRAAFAEIQGAHVELFSLLGLPSGYQRDLQRTKKPLMRAVNASMASLSLLPRFLQELEFDEENCKKTMDANMLATDKAVKLAVDGVPFRESYRRIKEEGADPSLDVKQAAQTSIEERISIGAPGALGLERLQEELALLQKRMPSSS